MKILTFKNLLTVFLVCTIVSLAWSTARTIFLIQKSKILVKNSSAFKRINSGASMRILILGDSTAVGTGSENPIDSTAGRLGNLYPQAEVINLAQNGLRIAGLQSILETIDIKERFDIVLIQIGANDIIRMTKLSDIEVGIKQILKRAEVFGGQVVILHSGNIGESRFFPWYLKSLLSIRSIKVREIYKKEAGMRYVDLFSEASAPKLRQDPTRYYAEDYLHLKGEGYGLWFEEIKKVLK